MSGINVIGGGLVANPGAGWQIQGTGDFFGDGNTDIVFQSTDGSVALWDMSGTNSHRRWSCGVIPGRLGTSRARVTPTSPFRTTTGLLALWDMSGPQRHRRRSCGQSRHRVESPRQ